MVMGQSMSIIEATRTLNMQYSTGIHIIRRYKRNGHFLDLRYKSNRGLFDQQ